MPFQSSIALCLLAFGLLILPANAQTAQATTLEEKERSAWKTLHVWSVTTLSLATAADIASSFKFSSDGQKEANPLLRSATRAYGKRGVAIEAGLLGGSLILQHYLVRKHPRLRVPFTIGNYALTGFQAFSVAHNVKY